MRRSTLWLAVALLLTAAAPRAVRACPLCAEAVTSSSGADDDDSTREARAYNNSIYLMAGMPYLMLGGVGFWVYRGIRRHNALTLPTETPAPSREATEQPQGNGTSLNENVSGTTTSDAGVR
jgi:hypothetical protein